MDVLLTWVGSRDPHWFNDRTNRREPGPILTLLARRPFESVYLLFNIHGRTGDFRKRATAIMRFAAKRWPSLTVNQRPVDVASVVDHLELYLAVNHEVQGIKRELSRQHTSPEFFVFLSPGTPQMHVVWVLLVVYGLLPATMIESTPLDLALPATPGWRVVQFAVEDFPTGASPPAHAREVGLLQARNEALEAEVEELREGIRAAQAAAIDSIPDGFDIRSYLAQRERALFLRALRQADGKAAAAARLLGIDPAAFRARAVTLGVRPRNVATRAQPSARVRRR